MSRITALLFLTSLLLAPSVRADDDSAPAEEPDVVETPAEDPGQGTVVVMRLDAEMINRGTGAWMQETLAAAQADGEVRAVVIVIDTPGGVLEETRLLVKAMLASELPIITYVGPPGSRAASAGVFITMAGHVAAMAPGTHTGAAHPVIMKPPSRSSDEDEDPEAAERAKDSEAAMLDKVTEDTVSFIRNIADLRGRNADWGERAVRDSVTVEEEEAVEIGVVDMVADSLDQLLEDVDGRVVEVAGGRRVVLRTRGRVIEKEMRLEHRVLYLLTDPTVAYLLLMAGLLGLGIEFRSPGLFVPGILGSIALMLALFSLNALPVNLVALLFVLLGSGLVVGDFFVPSYGLMTVGGVASLAFGGLFLVEETPEVPVGVEPVVVAVVALLALLLGLIIGWLVLRDRERKVYTGVEGILGARGHVTRAIPGGDEICGQVFVQGERWQSWSAAPLAKGTKIVVRAIDGMQLEVEAASGRE